MLILCFHMSLSSFLAVVLFNSYKPQYIQALRCIATEACFPPYYEEKKPQNISDALECCSNYLFKNVEFSLSLKCLLKLFMSEHWITSRSTLWYSAEMCFWIEMYNFHNFTCWVVMLWRKSRN